MYLDTMCEMVFRYGRTPYDCDADWDGERTQLWDYGLDIASATPLLKAVVQIIVTDQHTISRWNI